jgi:hypothetical protein
VEKVIEVTEKERERRKSEEFTDQRKAGQHQTF